MFLFIHRSTLIGGQTRALDGFALNFTIGETGCCNNKRLSPKDTVTVTPATTPVTLELHPTQHHCSRNKALLN
jgi:hypothetical protein